MTPDTPLALMLKGAGRYPFNGVFALALRTAGVRLDAVGRIAGSSSPDVTWDIVVQVSQALSGPLPGDRLDALRGVWDRVLTLPRQALGPAQGKDLSLFLVSQDAGGTSVAGVGLEMIWRWTPDRVSPLVSAGHPLLAPPGIPRLAPGALTLDGPLDGPLVAAAAGAQSVAVRDPQQTLALCGMSP